MSFEGGFSSSFASTRQPCQCQHDEHRGCYSSSPRVERGKSASVVIISPWAFAPSDQLVRPIAASSNRSIGYWVKHAVESAPQSWWEALYHHWEQQFLNVSSCCRWMVSFDGSGTIEVVWQNPEDEGAVDSPGGSNKHFVQCMFHPRILFENAVDTDDCRQETIRAAEKCSTPPQQVVELLVSRWETRPLPSSVSEQPAGKKEEKTVIYFPKPMIYRTERPTKRQRLNTGETVNVPATGSPNVALKSTDSNNGESKVIAQTSDPLERSDAAMAPASVTAPTENNKIAAPRSKESDPLRKDSEQQASPDALDGSKPTTSSMVDGNLAKAVVRNEKKKGAGDDETHTTSTSNSSSNNSGCSNGSLRKDVEASEKLPASVDLVEREPASATGNDGNMPAIAMQNNYKEDDASASSSDSSSDSSDSDDSDSDSDDKPEAPKKNVVEPDSIATNTERVEQLPVKEDGPSSASSSDSSDSSDSDSDSESDDKPEAPETKDVKPEPIAPRAERTEQLPIDKDDDASASNSSSSSDSDSSDSDESDSENDDDSKGPEIERDSIASQAERSKGSTSDKESENTNTSVADAAETKTQDESALKCDKAGTESAPKETKGSLEMDDGASVASSSTSSSSSSSSSGSSSSDSSSTSSSSNSESRRKVAAAATPTASIPLVRKAASMGRRRPRTPLVDLGKKILVIDTKRMSL